MRDVRRRRSLRAPEVKFEKEEFPMKNLKKVLALGLALVMILGMFTIASAAETKKTALDFTDWDEVEHKDAVALAVDLGIINGKPDGTFDPKGTIDRASWAKLVYFTATGDDNADAYLGTATGMKDITGNWAESYINYLVANKYVSGDGLGNYMPAGTVTVAAGLKTMLTVLGYDADDRGYQNDAAWAGNIMTDAKRNGLMDNVDRSQTAMVNLTRENAAQIVYNALQANTVESESRRDQGQSYVVSYTKGATLGYDVFNILKVTGIVTAIDSDGNAQFNNLTFDNGNSVTQKNLVSGKVKASAAVVGEEVSVFVKCTGASFSAQTGELNKTAITVKEPASTTVAKAASSAAATFTNGVSIADILGNGEKGTKADDYVGPESKDADGNSLLAYYVNGKIPATNPTEVKRGNIAEVYTNGDGDVTTIKITEWKVAQLGKDLETRTSDGTLQVRVNKVTSGWVDADKVDGYQGLVEDDVVLFYEGPNSTFVIEKAEKVTGKVTEREGKEDGSKLTINNTQYQQSKITGADTSFAAWDVADEKANEYDFYLDKNGTVCFKVLIEGETTTEVAYVLDSTFVGGNGSLTASKYAEAELLFTDGTTQIVNVAKIGGNTPVAANPGKDEVLGSDVTGDGANTITGKLIDFSVNSKGNYEVKLCTADEKVTDADIDEGAEIKPESNFVKGNTTLRADDKTVFLVKKGTGDDAQFFVYTGKNSVPKMTLTAAAVAVQKDGVVTYAYLQTDSYEGDTPDGYIYIKAVDDYRVNTSGLYVYYIYDAEGDKTTMALAEEVESAGFKKVTKVDETNGNEVEDVDVSATLTSVGNGIVVVGDKTFSYDKATIGVVVDLKKANDEGVNEFEDCSAFDPASFSLETEDYTYVAVRDAGTDDVCSFIYVIRTALN